MIDLATMQDSELYPATRNVSMRNLEWSADGASLLVTEGFSAAVAIDARSGARKVIAGNTTDGATFSSADGR